MWKESKVWENKKFRIVVLVELLLVLVCIIGILQGNRIVLNKADLDVSLNAGTYLEDQDGYYIDGSTGYNGTYLETEQFQLSPGVYKLTLYYETQDNGVNVFGIESSSGVFRGLLSNDVSLHSGIGMRTCDFYLFEKTDKLSVMVDYRGTQGLLVKDIEIVHTTAGSRMLLFGIVIFSLLINTLIMLYSYMGNHSVTTDRKLVWFGIPALAILASLPIFIDYIVIGADGIFHWLRIEALAQSISQGVFPTRVGAMWLYGHGYASSIFYGDTFLVLPALLRLIGFTLNTSYGIFVFAVNLATAIISYWCFKRCFKNRYIGMLGSMLYTLAPYRIYNIYNRNAVGEFTALTFIPLLCYGFYKIFTADISKKEYKYYWIPLVVGYSGMIQSHLLSCEIVGGFTILLCLILIKKVFRKQTFWQLTKVVVGTILINLWFLVPMLDMMVSGEYRFSQNMGEYIQKRGIFPAHIFYTMQNAGGSSRFHETGMLDTEPIGVGIALLAGVIVFWFIRKNYKKDSVEVTQNKSGIVAFVIGAIALVISTSYFPWDRIQTWNKITATLVPMIQFPTRLTIIATICMTFVVCIAGVWMLKHNNEIYKKGFFVVICGFCIFFSLYQTNDTLLQKQGVLRIYSIENIGHSAVLGAEYLPLGTELNFQHHEAIPSEGVTVEEYTKKNLDISMDVAVENGSGSYFVELPLLHYKGYQAKDVNTGERFTIVAGNNNDVRVLLPEGYQGTLRTWYAGMWYWRVSEVISLVTVVAILFLVFKRKKHQDKSLIER